MNRTTWRTALVATATALVLALTSCATGTQARQDTSFLGSTEIELCSPNPEGSEMQLGISTLDNSGHAKPALITGVELHNARGIRLVDAYVMPIDEWSSFMVGGVRDPDDPAWAAGVKVGDESAEPISGSDKGLMLVLSAPETGGSFEHVRVHFERGGSPFYADGVYSVEVSPVGVPCS